MGTLNIQKNVLQCSQEEAGSYPVSGIVAGVIASNNPYTPCIRRPSPKGYAKTLIVTKIVQTACWLKSSALIEDFTS